VEVSYGGHVYEKLRKNPDCFNIAGIVFVHVMNEALTFLLSFIRSFDCKQ